MMVIVKMGSDRHNSAPLGWMEYAHPLLLNSDDTYNLENLGNEVTLIKEIALRLLSENKVTLMKGTF